MIKIITASYASGDTLENICDDLVNLGLPSEKIFANTAELQIKVISGAEIESQILEVLNRHNPTETESHELEEKMTAKVITATYASADTLKNVVDDLINIGLPSEKIFADKNSNQVKVLAAHSIEPEIIEVLNRHNPTLVS